MSDFEANLIRLSIAILVATLCMPLIELLVAGKKISLTKALIYAFVIGGILMSLSCVFGIISLFNGAI